MPRTVYLAGRRPSTPPHHYVRWPERRGTGPPPWRQPPPACLLGCHDCCLLPCLYLCLYREFVPYKHQFISLGANNIIIYKYYPCTSDKLPVFSVIHPALVCVYIFHASLGRVNEFLSIILRVILIITYSLCIFAIFVFFSCVFKQFFLCISWNLWSLLCIPYNFLQFCCAFHIFHIFLCRFTCFHPVSLHTFTHTFYCIL